MNEQEIIAKIEEILKEKGQRYSRAYRAFEGGVRVIGVEPCGKEHRYAFSCNRETKKVYLEEM